MLGTIPLAFSATPPDYALVWSVPAYTGAALLVAAVAVGAGVLLARLRRLSPRGHPADGAGHGLPLAGGSPAGAASRA